MKAPSFYEHRAASRIPVLTPLDDLHRTVNAMGGQASDDFSRGYNAAISDVLDLIERAGGRDPLTL